MRQHLTWKDTLLNSSSPVLEKMKLNFHTCLWCSHLLSVNHNSPRLRRLEQNEHFICTYVLKLVPIPAFKHLLPREDHLLQYFDLEIVLT